MACTLETHMSPDNDDTLDLAGMRQQVEHVRMNGLFSIEETALGNAAALHLALALSLLEQARINLDMAIAAQTRSIADHQMGR